MIALFYRNVLIVKYSNDEGNDDIKYPTLHYAASTVNVPTGEK